MFILLIQLCTTQVPGTGNKALRDIVNAELIFRLDKERQKTNEQDN